MKKFLFLLTATLCAILLGATGCNPTTGPKTQPDDSGSEPGAEIVEYEIWENERAFPQELSPEMQNIIAKLKAERGYFAFNPQDFQTGDDLFVLISSGPKPTGGYSMTAKNIKASNGTLEITMEEREPAKEDAVIQILTYPVALLKVKALYNFFDITNTAGDTFSPIFLEESPENATAGRENVIRNCRGTLVGRIDSNSVEIESNGKTQAFYLSEQSLIENFKDGEKIIFDYYQDQYDRLIVNKLEKDS